MPETCNCGDCRATKSRYAAPRISLVRRVPASRDADASAIGSVRVEEGDAAPEVSVLLAHEADVVRHPASARFHALLDEIGALHDRKQQDYGRADDPFANVRASTDFGMPGWIGALVRGHDKMKRLQKVAQGGALANEAARDSFLDLAVYALIGLVLYEEEHHAS